MPWESEYAAIRARNLHLQRERRKRAKETCPSLVDWESRYLAAQRQRANALLKPGGDLSDEHQSIIDDLLLQRKKLLRAAGFTDNYLDLTYDCPICRDYGYTDGKPCACLLKKRFAAQTRKSNLVGFATQNFDKFDETIFPEKNGQRELMRKLHKLCLDYANSFPYNDPKNLVFIGNAGLGKSFLMHCVGRAVLDRGFSVLKITGNQFHQLVMEDLIGKRNPAPFHDLETTDLLLFDDLGCEPNAKGIVENYFFALLTERLSADRAMLTASNCSASEISDRYGERTLSRLLDRNNTRALAFKGQDLRLLKVRDT